MDGSSPHTWGTRQRCTPQNPQRRFIPTHVGNTVGAVVVPAKHAVHPHTRGEHAPGGAACGRKVGSSPHTWGTHCSQLIVNKYFITHQKFYQQKHRFALRSAPMSFTPGRKKKRHELQTIHLHPRSPIRTKRHESNPDSVLVLQTITAWPSPIPSTHALSSRSASAAVTSQRAAPFMPWQSTTTHSQTP